MPRKRRVDVRDIMPDNRFGCPICSKFINNLMHGGKKSIAEGIFYDALDIMGKKLSGEDPHQLFLQAVENVKPILEVRSRRVGGANYQVPIEVRPSRRQALSFRWILESSRKRPEKTMAERLAAELVDAYNKVGVSIKKREDTHKMAEANRAFAHYRF